MLPSCKQSATVISFSVQNVWMRVYALWQQNRTLLTSFSFYVQSSVQLNVYAVWNTECSHTILSFFKCSFVLCLYEQIVSAIGTIIDRQFDSHCVFARKISCLDKCFAVHTHTYSQCIVYGRWIGARCSSSVEHFHWISQMANDTYDDRGTKKRQ